MKKFLCVVLAVFFAGTAVAQQKEMSAKEIAAKGLKSVVFIKTKDTLGKPSGFGSGFFIAKNLIATNYHVVKDSTGITASSVYKTDEDFPCKVLVTSKDNDLAIIEIQGTTGIPLEIGLQDLDIGERVYAIGNPEGMGGTFSEGIISSLRNFKGFTNSVIQHTAAMSHGSSGGPLLNSSGEVIGINVAVDKTGQNLNYAIDSSDLLVLMAAVDSTDDNDSQATVLVDHLSKALVKRKIKN